jgi:hypothetical protein
MAILNIRGRRTFYVSISFTTKPEVRRRAEIAEQPSNQ